VADARVKNVLRSLADLHSEVDYAIDQASTSLSQQAGAGDVLEIPDITSLTVVADGDTDTAGQTVTTNVTTLNVNLNPWINARLPQRAQAQLLNSGGAGQGGTGVWAQGVARTAISNLRASIDSNYLTHIVTSAWETGVAVANHTNVAGDTLTSADILNAMAALTDNQGVTENDLVLFMSAYGAASIRSISTFVPNGVQAERGNLGIPMIGTVHGVPIYQSSQVPRLRTVTSTAWDISTNVLTITVAAGHGIAAGQLLTFDTVTAGGDMSTATAVTSTTSTVITIAHTASDASATEAGTITIDDSENVMIATNHNYTARSIMPRVRVVPDPDSSGDHMQISMVWGRIARAGYANVIHSPQTSI